jgi:hypothetical protein
MKHLHIYLAVAMLVAGMTLHCFGIESGLDESALQLLALFAAGAD